jgi:hypothetical protein
MPIDAWPFFRSRADPGSVLSDQVDRLTGLGVALTVIPLARSRALFRAFAEQFVDPHRVDEIVARREHEGGRRQGVEMGRWLRPDRTRPGGPAGVVRWLTGADPAALCLRFDPRGSLPALEIRAGTLADAWAASWPGVLVSFERGRAVAISLDYEDLRCDLRAAPATPYR